MIIDQAYAFSIIINNCCGKYLKQSVKAKK